MATSIYDVLAGQSAIDVFNEGVYEMSLRLKEKSKFCTKKEIDSFIKLSSDNLNFILSKYTNHPNKHNNLSKMCNFALNIKCMRSLSYNRNCYFEYDKNWC